MIDRKIISLPQFPVTLPRFRWHELPSLYFDAHIFYCCIRNTILFTIVVIRLLFVGTKNNGFINDNGSTSILLIANRAVRARIFICQRCFPPPQWRQYMSLSNLFLGYSLFTENTDFSIPRESRFICRLISLKPTSLNNPKIGAWYLTRNPWDFRLCSAPRSRSNGPTVSIPPIRRLNELFHYSASPTPLKIAAIGLTNFAVCFRWASRRVFI